MHPSQSRARRECPHCKSLIRPDATVCAHCQRESTPWRWHEGKWWVGQSWLDERSNTFVRYGDRPPPSRKASTTTPSQRYAIASLIVGVVVGFLSEATLGLSSLWTFAPVIVGIIVAASLYGALIEVKAHENLADRD